MIYPRAVLVKPLADKKLSVTFSNGETRCFDVTPYLDIKWYKELLDDGVFKTVHIAGHSIEWQNGQDIAPDCLYVNSTPCGIN